MNQVRNTYSDLSKRLLTWNLRKLTAIMLVIALLLGIVATTFWYNELFMTNERRFWNAIGNSMSTQSVVRTLTNGGSGNQVVQQNRFFFGEETLAESRVEFTNRSATVDTSVATEGITTLDSQFSRYVAFETNEAREDGSVPNLDGLLGLWSGETVGEDGLEEARLNYVSELVTLAVFGNFDSAFRSSVVEAFRDNDVYQFDVNTVQEVVENDEVLLSYGVSVGLRAYAEQLQRSFMQAGLGDFPPLDPENYREDSRISARFLIRPEDNTLRGIQFGDRNETYANYGVIKDIEIPTPVLTPEELEAQVQQEIQG